MATTVNKLTRVSPGVYRSSGGQLVQSRTGVPQAPKPPPNRTNTQTTNTNQNTQTTNTNQNTQTGGINMGTYNDPVKVQNRIDYLSKIRPNDPEIAQLRGWLTKYGSPVNQGTYNNAQRVTNRIAWLQKNKPNDPEIKRLQNWYNQFGNPQQAGPAQEAPPTAPATNTPEAEPPAPNLPDQAALASYQSPMTKALMEAFGQGMSTMQAYEPKTFEGSPLYQFQKQKGLGDLEKLMSARGLTGSGAEIQGNSDFLAQLNATEAEKQRQYAEANRDRSQRAMEFIANFDRSERETLRDQWNTDLDRQTNISQFEATRGDNRQEAALNFLNSILGYQSQNDIARLSQSGLGAQTDLTKALIQAITGNTMAQAPRVSGGGGGTPPPPQQSNMTDFYKILMDYGNRGGNNDFFNSILSFLR
jgi:hypothetical protein